MLGSRLAGFDFVTSNHRCHGHFIGATGNWRGLIDEIIGNADGVCARHRQQPASIGAEFHVERSASGAYR